MFGFGQNTILAQSNEERTTVVAGDTNSSANFIIVPWSRPVNAKFISFVCIGPGGPGGNGSASGASFAGGGGGGAGAITSATYQASLIPETVYLYAGNSLTPVSFSAVSLEPDLNAKDAAFNLCFANGGGAGGDASAGTAGTAGAAAAVSTIADASYMALAYWHSLAGVAGTAGATSAASATAITALASSIVSGGTGGGYDSTFVAGNITGAGIIPTITAPVTTTGTEGTGGFWLWKPLMGTGGTGGAPATNSSGTGGTGGSGAFGCGGGGGGRGGPVGNIGPGGKGGPGIVMVTWW